MIINALIGFLVGILFTVLLCGYITLATKVADYFEDRFGFLAGFMCCLGAILAPVFGAVGYFIK